MIVLQMQTESISTYAGSPGLVMHLRKHTPMFMLNLSTEQMSSRSSFEFLSMVTVAFISLLLHLNQEEVCMYNIKQGCVG